MKRKEFVKKSALLGGGLFFIPSYSCAPELTLFNSKEIDEFVTLAHSDYEGTKKTIEAKPLILNCASQLAKGDFETAIEAASHMGRKDIADVLIEHGCRMNIFTFAFLGYNSLVMNLIKIYPNMLNSYGPHGFTLLHHAKVGKNQELADWLVNEGLNTDIFENLFDF